MAPHAGGGSLGQAALPSPFSGTSFGQEESKADRRRRKDAERLAETRVLDPWERYRALSDHVDHLLDVTELADRKTRFALVILGALNAVNVLIAIRAPQLGGDALSPVLLQSYITGYVLLSLYAAVFAIIALRPRSQEMHGAAVQCEPTGMSLLAGTPNTDADAYYDTWRQAELSQVNRELAMRSHLLARANTEKFRALRRVYEGLLVLVALTAVVALFIGFHAMASTTAVAAVAATAGL
jgi:hypothetical protein